MNACVICHWPATREIDHDHYCEFHALEYLDQIANPVYVR